MLTITNGEPGTLSCTAPSQGFYDVHFYCNNCEDTTADIRDHDRIFHQVLSWPDSPVCSNRNCTHSLNISWTMNDIFRRELDSIRCLFLFHDSTVCNTEQVTITFEDIGKKLRICIIIAHSTSALFCTLIILVLVLLHSH